ncbi:MAG: helix-turn-helix domain-containing protein [bacterium]
MALIKSSVPGLSRGLKILRLLAEPMTVEDIVRRAGVPKSSGLRILDTLRGEGLVMRDPVTRLYQAASELTTNHALAHADLMPGDAEWMRSPGDWFRQFTRQSLPYVTTYGSRGDADVGVMWRLLPSGTGFDRLSFTVHGGHAEIMLIQGGSHIPTDGDICLIRRNLHDGLYGRMLLVVKGRDSNDTAINVIWNVDGNDGEDLKVVIMDALDEAWGFISVSRMTMRHS